MHFVIFVSLDSHQGPFPSNPENLSGPQSHFLINLYLKTERSISLKRIA